MRIQRGGGRGGGGGGGAATATFLFTIADTFQGESNHYSNSDFYQDTRNLKTAILLCLLHVTHSTLLHRRIRFVKEFCHLVQNNSIPVHFLLMQTGVLKLKYLRESTASDQVAI